MRAQRRRKSTCRPRRRWREWTMHALKSVKVCSCCVTSLRQCEMIDWRVSLTMSRKPPETGSRPHVEVLVWIESEEVPYSPLSALCHSNQVHSLRPSPTTSAALCLKVNGNTSVSSLSTDQEALDVAESGRRRSSTNSIRRLLHHRTHSSL